MIKKAGLILSLSVGALLTGCGSVKLADPERSASVKSISPSATAGQIFVCRNAFIGAAIKPTIELDGQPIAVIGRNTFSFNEVTPGDHVLVAKSPEHDSTLPFSIAAGQQKYFQTWISMGVFVGWAVIDEWEPEEARKCVDESDLVEPEAPAKTVAK
jgi:hypothetical protein